MILPGAVFAQENLAAAPACTQNEGCQATQHKPGCPVGQALLQDDDPGNMPANGNAPLNNEDDDPGNMPANGNASLNNEGGQAAPKAAGPYEYNGVSYPALSDAVKAVGARAGTVYVTEDAFIRSNEIIEIPAGADITITSKGGAAFRITKEAHRFVFKLLGGKLTLETVVLLSQQKPDDTIEIDLDLDELDATTAETKATYEEIKAYVWDKHHLKVSSLYISQVKRKCGLEVGQNYNLSKSENPKVPKCPPEKEAAIMDALKHFQMI